MSRSISATYPRPALFSITWPLFTELLLGMLVGLVGLSIASRSSDAASGAFALANHVQATFFLLFRIVSLGVSVVITQNLGAGNRVAADQTARAALGASTWMGIVTAASVALSADLLLKLLNAPPEVLSLALPYLRILALALALDALNAAMSAVMRAHLRARDARFPVAAGVLSMVFVMGGGAWLLGVHWGFGLAGVWFAYAADEWLRGLMMAARWYRRGWVPHARATHRRVGAQRRRVQAASTV